MESKSSTFTLFLRNILVLRCGLDGLDGLGLMWCFRSGVLNAFVDELVCDWYQIVHTIPAKNPNIILYIFCLSNNYVQNKKKQKIKTVKTVIMRTTTTHRYRYTHTQVHTPLHYVHTLIDYRYTNHANQNLKWHTCIKITYCLYCLYLYSLFFENERVVLFMASVNFICALFRKCAWWDRYFKRQSINSINSINSNAQRRQRPHSFGQLVPAFCLTIAGKAPKRVQGLYVHDVLRHQ